nr:MAG TPA: hypothetical protein [Caudoviricetes sp.]
MVVTRILLDLQPSTIDSYYPHLCTSRGGDTHR